MLRNYLIVALRNLKREKLHSVINVAGLAAAVACCFLIALFVRHERSYDRFHDEADRIYRAWGREDWGEGRTFFYTVTPVPLAEALEANIPEVEETVRVRAFEAEVGSGPDRFNEDVRMVDASFFDVFDFSLRAGDPAGAFSHPNSVIITPAVAERYFDTDDVLGQTLSVQIVGAPEEYVVTGIVDPPPTASSIQFDALIPFSKAPDLMNEQALTSFFNVMVETYVLLRDDAAQTDAEAKLPVMIEGILGDEARQSGYQIGFQPITDIHLATGYPTGIEPISDPVYSYFLMGIAALVLIIACINFVMLSIGQSERRGREVGVRKSLGADRHQLMRQFWGEAGVLVTVAVAAGTAAAWVLVPVFSDLSGRTLSPTFDLWTGLFLIALVGVVAALAGIYPAVVLSAHTPTEALRGRLRAIGDRGLLRKTLVVVQFAISILLMVVTLFVVRQLDYLRERDLGFDREQVVVIRTGQGGDEADDILARMRDALSGRPDIISMAYSAFPMNDPWARFGFETEAGTYAEFMANHISPEFLETMDIEVVAGRAFTHERTTDSTSILVNEAFVREFGLGSPASALGQRLPSRSYTDHEIVGVVADFNYQSLHDPIRPLVLARTTRWLFEGSSDINVASSMSPDLAIRIASNDYPATISHLEDTWKTTTYGRPFEFYFLDEALDARYRQEEQLSRIVSSGAILAILIACMGLYGLATLTVVRRRKEIGIRKVLGATVPNILVLVCRDFAFLVGIAFVLSAPAAYLLVRQWLEDYAFRVDVDAGTFVTAGLLAVVMALAAVSWQSVQAALADPVQSLRNE